CDAVQHAHQRGVIHRDLKPANILVTEDAADKSCGVGDKPSSLGAQRSILSAQPKILDFGVARLVDQDHALTSMQTGAGQMLGALPYMSPDQVAGDTNEVDTRCDIYALGVLLFQLLAGRLPIEFSGKSIPNAARMIREVEPPRLGTLDRALRGD